MATNNTFTASYNFDEINTYNKNQLIEIVTFLHNRVNAPRSNKKFDVLQLLRENEALSIQQIADMLQISTKNVSSLLTYLRKDGYTIHTDQDSRKYLTNRDQIVETPTNEQPEENQ